jgi:putative phage-type endonuclease
MDYDVTIDRAQWIGGSDVPCIMGISPFKTRYELLLEKSGLKEPDFKGNAYTVYGTHLEPQIRDYINSTMPEDAQFEPNRTIEGCIRAHTDGFNGRCVLEIKTTSQIHDTVDGYKIYLVQLLLYMRVNKVDSGMLAVYNRPKDFDEEFDKDRLTIYEIDAKEYEDLTNEIFSEIDRFLADLQRLKENPLLTEQDFQPNELIALSEQVLALENQLANYKAIEQRYNDMKQKLFEAMQNHDVKSWQMVNGTRITRVDGTEAKTELVTEFDEKRFKAEHPDEYESYSVTKEKKTRGRAGYIKITLPKV